MTGEQEDSHWLCCAIQSAARGRAEARDDGLPQGGEGASLASTGPKAATERCYLAIQMFVKSGGHEVLPLSHQLLPWAAFTGCLRSLQNLQWQKRSESLPHEKRESSSDLWA